MTYETISANHEWIPGETYRLTFEIEQKFFVFGTTEQRKRELIQTAIMKIANDPRLELISADSDNQTLIIEARAIDHGSPIRYVIGGLIALAVIIGISLILIKTEKLVSTTGDVIEKAPIATSAISLAVLAAVLVGGAVVAKRYVAS